MFDDHQQPGAAGAPPSNLPVGEPEDIFASTDAPLGDIPTPPAAAPPPATSTKSTPPSAPPPPPPAAKAPTPPPAAAPSAVSAGVLKPAQPPSPSTQAAAALGSAKPVPTPGQQQPAASSKQTYKVQGPSFVRTALLIVVFLIIIAAVVGGAWWAYAAFIKNDGPVTPPPSQQPPSETTDAPALDDTTSDATQPEDEITTDDQILFGELVDSDNDGLDDEQEQRIGTDPQNWDTDGDELSDYNEVAVWKTDPFSIDTDGDTFLDGEEVNNGYNPAGQGRIFEPPTATLDDVFPEGEQANGSSPSGARPPTADSPSSPQPTVISGDGKACDGDGNCFLASAATCEKATHTRVTLLDLWDALGVRQQVTHYMQILGYNDAGLCDWYLRIDDVDITFREDIDPEIQAENRQALETTIGWDGACTMTSAELAALIQQWNNGGFSSDDLGAPQCQGRIFTS